MDRVANCPQTSLTTPISSCSSQILSKELLCVVGSGTHRNSQLVKMQGTSHNVKDLTTKKDVYIISPSPKLRDGHWRGSSKMVKAREDQSKAMSSGLGGAGAIMNSQSWQSPAQDLYMIKSTKRRKGRGGPWRWAGLTRPRPKLRCYWQMRASCVVSFFLKVVASDRLSHVVVNDPTFVSIWKAQIWS